VSAGPLVSVVIRAKDEAGSIGRTLEMLSAQTAAEQSQVIVVDSGSRDATVAIARDSGARVIEIPAAGFTYGGALNTGCSAAGGELLVALSAHAFPRDDGWLERMIEPFGDERVACACGYGTWPDGSPLRGRVLQDTELARREPRFGYSNSSGAFRASLWRERPFREDMPGTEDKEWAWHWLQRGLIVVIDPALATVHDHDYEGPVETYRRARREWAGLIMYREDVRRQDVSSLLRRWWRPDAAYGSRARALASPKRAARLLGERAGRRAGVGSRNGR
jgi:rhamnosyltransferase